MDKYTLLIILNLPFVIFGIIKAIVAYKTGAVQRGGLVLRLLFWSAVGIGLLFARNFYNLLRERGLTDTAPLSLADVVLVTGVIFSMFLILRLYAKLDQTEKRLTDMHEKMSIELSDPNIS